MLKSIRWMGAIMALLLLCFPDTVRAQIAPTNSATISGSVSDSTGKSIANAMVSLRGPRSASSHTDANGLFVFVGMPFGTYQISVTAAGFGTAARSILAEGDINVAIQYEPTLKVIASISSIANAGFNVTPASVTHVNPKEAAFAGQTSWRKILEQIPGVAQAGVQAGNNVMASLPDGPFVPMQISINGALPYETATLLDDMPLIGGGPAETSALTAGKGTNLADYPLNGFDSADVVRGPGANAPSIVDSIGGSFVLHAPGFVNRNHYGFSLSTDPYGGIVENTTAAIRWKKLSAVLTYGINDSPGPQSHSGAVGSSVFAPSAINGLPFSCTGSCAPITLQSPAYAPASGPTYGVRTGLITAGIPQSATTAWSQHSGSASLNYAFSPVLSVGIFYAGQDSQMMNEGLPYYTNTFVPPAGYTGSFPAGQNVMSQNVFLAPRPVVHASSLVEEKLTAQLGRGVLRFAALQNRIFSTYSFASPATLTAQLFGGGTLNGTPTVFNGDTYTISYPLTFNFSSFNGSNNRDMLFSYATPVGENLNVGASFVTSYYDIPSSFNEKIGTRVLGGSTPSSISNTTNESRIFIGMNPSAKTSLDLSMYMANANYHIQDPNNTATYTDAQYHYAAPRLGFVWRPTASVAVRASVGGGFAEAPLSDLVGSNGTPNCASGTSCSVTLTNLNLQPEKSFAFDAGTDIRVARDTVFSFDVYRSNLYGQIYNSTSLTGTFNGLPLYTTQFGNLGQSRYEGVLLDLRHDAPRGFNWALSGGLTRGYVVSVPANFYNTPGGTCVPATGVNCTNVTVVPNANFNGTFVASIPYAQGLGKIGYRWTPDKYVDIVGTYYGNNNSYFRPAFVELDAHARVPLFKASALLMTFRNITGVYGGAFQTWSPANFSGAPTISGLPYALFGEEYGPRTVILTTSFSL